MAFHRVRTMDTAKRNQRVARLARKRQRAMIEAMKNGD